ncbi:hypothetical protein [Niabella aquatica]
MKGLAEILNILDSIGPAIAVSLLMAYKKSLSDEMLLILVFCSVQLYCNTVATIIERVIDGNNYWVYKINFTACFLVLLYLFAKKLVHLKSAFFYILLLLYSFISFFLVKNGGGVSYFNSISAALENFIIVVLCVYFFYRQLINTSEEVSIPETSIFWCIVGIFTYYAGAFFIFISYKYLIHTDSNTIAVLWRFHNVLLFICSLYISYGVLCKNYRTILL